MSGREELLFYGYDLREVMEKHLSSMKAEVDSFDENKLLNTSETDLIDYFVEKYYIQPLNLIEEEIFVDQEEVEVNVYNGRSHFILDPSKPIKVKGTKITLYVPFDGPAYLFNCQPSTYNVNPPRGSFKENILKISEKTTEHDSKAIKKKLNKKLQDVKKYIERIREDIKPWNGSLNKKTKDIITKRKAKLLKDRKLVSELGFPMIRRDENHLTYTAPEVRRKVNPKPPKASDEPYHPEPVLDMREYENIIEIICQTAKMLERSPSTFKDMGEEQLRDQFLVPLNSHYEGQATGETFNSSGKTDILIRVKDKSVFIAECKIWRGKKTLKEAIDQLLGYTTWRDTKTALIIFNRNKNLSSVLDQIEPEIIEHPCCKKREKYDDETVFRFILGHPNDPNREMVLTVLVFDVPT